MGGDPQVVIAARDNHLASIEPRELIPGHRGRFVHSEHTTHVYWEIDEGAQLPEHSHPHEQIVNMLEGTYELTVDGERYGDVRQWARGATGQ